MEMKRLAQLIKNYGDKVGEFLSSKVWGRDRDGGTLLSTHTESKYLIRGLVFQVNYHHISGNTHLDDIYIQSEQTPYVHIYSGYNNIPLEGSWIKVVEEIAEVLEQVEEDDIATRRNAFKQSEKDRQLKIKQTIKEWNDKYGSK